MGYVRVMSTILDGNENVTPHDLLDIKFCRQSPVCYQLEPVTTSVASPLCILPYYPKRPPAQPLTLVQCAHDRRKLAGFTDSPFDHCRSSTSYEEEPFVLVCRDSKYAQGTLILRQSGCLDPINLCGKC